MLTYFPMDKWSLYSKWMTKKIDMTKVTKMNITLLLQLHSR
jgi:hypothetical protein